MIKVFNSAYTNNGRYIPFDEIKIIKQDIGLLGRPYIMFEHPDFPLGPLKAEFRHEVWECDLD